MLKKTDLRVIRTRKMIKESFIDLIQEKGYESITIRDIADNALINRATFYLHYVDKQDLVDKLIDEVFEELTDIINPCIYIQKKRVNISKFQSMIEAIFTNIFHRAAFYQIMLSEKGVHGFNRKMQEVIQEKFRKEFATINLQEQKFSTPPELLIHFISSALIGTVEWWVNNDLVYSPKHMAVQLVHLVTIGPLQSSGFEIEA
ncbi:TetR/AcrR family transcriptional regulator [Priestia megaterium NCT-2]|uniref:TetR/AcrR family transcriptional regulator n=1 Tax=Priestia megaterium TaxID=1404 RepID=UPI0003482B7D|nr:TetR/AcrR family transcriptional regulator [Priestia megaterium]AYE50779.1 TetR/AcrR family transcriptional regulator [Priestia megaterium NCT-2]UMZ30903.1 TetR/AcrR family transcriptional regulator [Priestia megaterium]